MMMTSEGGEEMEESPRLQESLVTATMLKGPNESAQYNRACGVVLDVAKI